MFLKQSLSLFLSWCLLLTTAPGAFADQANQSEAPPPVQAAQQTPTQLQQLVAPIALYPDALVAQILAAATYPDQIVEADRWLQQHTDLKGAQLGQEVDKQPWDPSVKALTEFPSVLGMQAIAEAVVLGQKVGLNRERLLEVLSQLAVIAPAHVGKLAGAAINDYRPQFPLRLMHKDFQLILQASAQEHVFMPATVAAFRVNSDELPHNDEEDFSAVLRRMEEVAGLAAIDLVTS
jgi:hypothetical protein